MQGRRSTLDFGTKPLVMKRLFHSIGEFYSSKSLHYQEEE